MIEVMLLLALPASGKSEIRRYFESLSRAEARRAFGVGPLVQLDDFPYVYVMRRVSEIAAGLGIDPPFFSGDGPFIDRRDWGTLIHLLNQDFEALRSPPTPDQPAAKWLLERMTEARRMAGAVPLFEGMDGTTRRRIEEGIEVDARGLLHEASARCSEPGDTVIVEFARGARAGSSLPLRAPFGYRHALSQLSAEILERACILYVRVDPEESRRKNRERSTPGEEGSILHHGVPEQVMVDEYGMDDFLWLMSQARRPGYIDVEAGGRTHELPAAVFDNRGDFTSFLREDPETWDESDVVALERQLVEAVGRLTA